MYSIKWVYLEHSIQVRATTATSSQIEVSLTIA